MNYINNGIIRLNKSPIILLAKLLFSNLLLDIVAIIILLINYLNMYSNGHSILNTEQIFYIFVLFVQLLIMIFIFTKWIYTFFEFKNNKLTYYTGVVFKRKQEFILDKISSINFKQGLMGKIFNFGDVLLYIGNERFKLKGIYNPNEFIKLMGVYKEEK